jgi:hypothetical protein
MMCKYYNLTSSLNGSRIMKNGDLCSELLFFA